MYYIKLDESKKHLFPPDVMRDFNDGVVYVSHNECHLVSHKGDAHIYDTLEDAQKGIESEWEIVEKA